MQDAARLHLKWNEFLALGKALGPRMNASNRPSGERAGAIAESVKSVSLVNVSDGGPAGESQT